MVCTRVTLPGGQPAIICGPRKKAKKCGCGSRRLATLLCDWKTPDGPAETCDAPICGDCTHVPAPDKDLCPAHAAEWKARQP